MFDDGTAYREENEAGDLCESCQGAGEYSIGDCEDGVVECCPECDGLGRVYDY